MHKPHPIPAFHLLDNYLWLLQDKQSAWIVDPGDAKPVIEYLTASKCQLEGILLTHHHWDHVNGAKELRDKYSVPIFGPANSPFKHIDKHLKDKDTLKILDRSFEIMSIPGHTLDHIAYYAPASQHLKPWLFCGDVLFAGGCGRVFEGDAAMMWDSLSKLANLPEDTEVYCGHEYTVDNLHFAVHLESNNKNLNARLKTEMDKRARHIPTLPTSIALERQTNPFLRANCQKLHAVLGYQDTENVDAVSVFANLRAQKDQFKAPIT